MAKIDTSAAAGMLGRIKSKAKTAAARVNGRLGGRPRRYRLHRGSLQERQGKAWVTVDKPFTRKAREAYRRLVAE